MSDYKKLKEKLETILTLPELPFEEDLTAVDCKQMYDILCKIEQGTLIDTDKWFIEKEDNHGRVRYLICKYDKWLTISDLCLTREEAEKRLKELQE